NILIANPAASESDLAEAIRSARLDGFVAGLSAGLDTVVGDRGLKLSGGERQRVALARALLRKASILLLDEPTSALDAKTEAEIADDLLQASNGRTTLIVTHRLPLAAQADRVIVLHEGVVVEQGTHVTLLSAGGHYTRLWRRNAEQ